MVTARSAAVFLGYQKIIKGIPKGIKWDTFCSALENCGYDGDTIDDDTEISNEIMIRLILHCKTEPAKKIKNKIIKETIIPMLESGQLPKVSKIINSIPFEAKPTNSKKEPTKKAKKEEEKKKPKIVMSPWEVD